MLETATHSAHGASDDERNGVSQQKRTSRGVGSTAKASWKDRAIPIKPGTEVVTPPCMTKGKMSIQGCRRGPSFLPDQQVVAARAESAMMLEDYLVAMMKGGGGDKFEFRTYGQQVAAAQGDASTAKRRPTACTVDSDGPASYGRGNHAPSRRG